jgi:hypothetical protein
LHDSSLSIVNLKSNEKVKKRLDPKFLASENVGKKEEAREIISGVTYSHLILLTKAHDINDMGFDKKNFYLGQNTPIGKYQIAFRFSQV